MAGVVLHESPYLHVGYDDGARHVRVTRTAQRFESASAVDVAFDAAEAALGGFRRGTLGLLVDQRTAPLLPDDAVEGVILRRMTKLITGFAAVVVIVSTPTGLLEMGRRKREGGPEYRSLQAFTDEASALSALRTALSERP